MWFENMRGLMALFNGKIGFLVDINRGIRLEQNAVIIRGLCSCNLVISANTDDLNFEVSNVAMFRCYVLNFNKGPHIDNKLCLCVTEAKCCMSPFWSLRG